MSEWLELKLSSEFANNRREHDQLSTKSVHSANCEPEKEAKRRQINDSQERSPVSHRLHFVWATRQTTDVSDQRMFMKTALRELLLHLVFVTLLLLITVLTIHKATFFYYTSVFELTAGTYHSKDGDSKELYHAVYTINEIWSYIRLQVFDALYWDTWYNKRNVSFSEREFIGLDNKLLGVPRLRQVRVRSESCSVPAKMIRLVQQCYPSYSVSAASTLPIQPRGGLVPNYTVNAWKFQTSSQTSAIAFDGPLGNYGGSGYVQDLSRSREVSELMLEELFRGRWIDKATRALFLDFAIYNANINMYMIVKIIFEMPYTGGVFVSSDFQPAKLVRYLTTTDYFVMGCEIIYLLFVIYYIIEEIVEVIQMKWRYLSDVWNLLDTAVLGVSVTCAVFTVCSNVAAVQVMNQLLENMDSYPHFDRLSYWYAHFARATAMCVFLVILKIFKYVNFDKSLGQLTKTLSEAAADLFGFLVMFCIVYFAFAQFGYLAFGADTEGFQSFTHSCYSLFRMIVGDIDFHSLQRTQFILGPLFFVMFIFFSVFVLLNMFLAIVNESYTKVKERMANRGTQLKLEDMLKKSTKEMINRMKRKTSRKPLVQILRSMGSFGKEGISFEEYRDELKMHGYRDAEITVSFIKYDLDGDNCLNLKEQAKLEDETATESILQMRMPIGEMEGNEGSDVKEGDLVHDISQQDEPEYVDVHNFTELEARVSVLQQCVATMLAQSDHILVMLEQAEVAKRDIRLETANIMRKETSGEEQDAEEV